MQKRRHIFPLSHTLLGLMQYPKSDFVVAQMDYMDAAVKVSLQSTMLQELYIWLLIQSSRAYQLRSQQCKLLTFTWGTCALYLFM